MVKAWVVADALKLAATLAGCHFAEHGTTLGWDSAGGIIIAGKAKGDGEQNVLDR